MEMRFKTTLIAAARIAILPSLLMAVAACSPVQFDTTKSNGDGVTTNGTAAGVRDAGGVLEVVAHALEVKGPAQSMPDHLVVDVTNLGLHEHVTAAQIPLPEGFAMLTAGDTLVITVGLPRASVAAGTDNETVQPTEAPEGA